MKIIALSIDEMTEICSRFIEKGKKFEAAQDNEGKWIINFFNQDYVEVLGHMLHKTVHNEIIRLITTDQYILAVKYLRDKMNMGLKTAKMIVDDIKINGLKS